MSRRRKTQKWQNEVGTPTYFAWRSMRGRCLNPVDPAFHNYGERGITVCHRWAESFDAFVADMGLRPDGLTLERIKNDREYSPKNCRWATPDDQRNNQRRSAFVEHSARRLTIAQWAKELGISFDTLWRRLHRPGMSVERALTAGLLTGQLPAHGTRAGYDKGCRCDSCKSFHNERMRERRSKRKR